MIQVNERGQNGLNRSYITPPHHRRSNKKGTASKVINKYQPAILKKTPTLCHSLSTILSVSIKSPSYPTWSPLSTLFSFGGSGGDCGFWVRTLYKVNIPNKNNMGIKYCIEQYRRFIANVTKPVLTGWNRLFTSYLGTLSVPFRYLNTMIIQPKYNSPSSDVSTSNGSPLHSDGSHPIGGYLLGNNNG